MKKRILSIVLAFALVFAIMATGVVSVAAKSIDDGRVLTSSNPEISTRRYYFLMPPSWENSYTEANQAAEPNNTPVAGCYWWGNYIDDFIEGETNNGVHKMSYVGETKEGKIFYIDCPVIASAIIFNNYVDGGIDPEQPIYYAACKTIDIGAEYYDPGESDNYPDGVGMEWNDAIDAEVGFDNMIYVIEREVAHMDVWSNKERTDYEGEWYFFYGDGTYGTYQTKEEAEANNAVKGVMFETTKPVVGDVNCDGTIDIQDATIIQKYLASVETLSLDEIMLCDFDRDGEVTVMDATAIQMYSVLR